MSRVPQNPTTKPLGTTKPSPTSGDETLDDILAEIAELTERLRASSKTSPDQAKKIRDQLKTVTV